MNKVYITHTPNGNDSSLAKLYAAMWAEGMEVIEPYPDNAFKQPSRSGKSFFSIVYDDIEELLDQIPVINVPKNLPHGPVRKGKGGKSKRW